MPESSADVAWVSLHGRRLLYDGPGTLAGRGRARRMGFPARHVSAILPYAREAGLFAVAEHFQDFV